MTSATEALWPEFWLRTFALHWITASVLVLAVAVAMMYLKRLNATTRHTVWLLTLTGCALIPLLIFAPRPDTGLPDPVVSESVTPSLAEASPDGLHMPGSSGTGHSATGAPEPADAVSLSLVFKSTLLLWSVGVIVLLARLRNDFRAARELALQSEAVPPRLRRRFESLCARIGIEQHPRLRFHPAINAPMTVGLVNVWVVIPMDWCEAVDDAMFDQTLMHELGHVARRDPVFHALQRVLSALLWMHPAVWYAARQLEIERESACDDWVLAHDDKCSTYANNLLDVAESLYLQPRVLAVGCVRSHSQLSKRIHNLLDHASDHRLGHAWPPLAVTAVVLCATLSVSAVVLPDVRELAPPQAPGDVVAPSVVPRAPAPPRVELTAVRETSFLAVSPDAVSKPASAPRPVPAPLPAVIPAPVASDLAADVHATNAPLRAQGQEARAPESDATAAGRFTIERWPVRAKRISQRYGVLSKRSADRDKRHEGLDFPAREGTDIRAVAAGHVEDSGFSTGYGYYVVINHGNGYKTKYANNLENLVTRGDAVTAQQLIARVGNSGRNSTGPHLHFEVSLRDATVDPETLFTPVSSK